MKLPPGKPIAVCLLICLTAGAPAAAEDLLNRELFEELLQAEHEKPEIPVPEYERFELANGMTVYLAEDDEFPLVEFIGFVEGGRRQETRDTAGLSPVMAEMMGSGTKSLDEESFFRKKELHGITLQYDAGQDVMEIYGSVLVQGKEDAVELLAESLQNPDFQAPRLQRVLQEQYQYAAQAALQEAHLLRSEFYQAVYQDHPYSYEADIQLAMENLEAGTAREVKSLYQESIGPENLVLAVVGDIDKEKTQALLEDQFAQWEPQGIDLEEEKPPEVPAGKGEVLIVDKEDAEHAYVKIGHGFEGHSFDRKTDFLMGNRIFGLSGFSSRLVEEVRSEKGYVYSIHSQVSYHELGGAYYIRTEADTEKAPDVLEAVKNELDELVTGRKEITDEELRRNINLYNGLLPASYMHPADTVSELIREAELLGNDDDYLEEFIREYQDLEAQDVQQVMEDAIRPQEMVTVAAGNSKELKEAFLDAGYDEDDLEIITY